MKKKSLVGWTGSDWDLWFQEHRCNCQPKCKPHKRARIRIEDLISEFDISSKARMFYQPVKVRITIEEIKATRRGLR